MTREQEERRLQGWKPEARGTEPGIFSKDEDAGPRRRAPGVPHPASGGLHGRAYAGPRGAGKSHRTPATAVGSELEQAPNSGVFIVIIFIF